MVKQWRYGLIMIKKTTRKPNENKIKSFHNRTKNDMYLQRLVLFLGIFDWLSSKWSNI